MFLGRARPAMSTRSQPLVRKAGDARSAERSVQKEPKARVRERRLRGRARRSPRLFGESSLISARPASSSSLSLPTRSGKSRLSVTLSVLRRSSGLERHAHREATALLSCRTCPILHCIGNNGWACPRRSAQNARQPKCGAHLSPPSRREGRSARLSRGASVQVAAPVVVPMGSGLYLKPRRRPSRRPSREPRRRLRRRPSRELRRRPRRGFRSRQPLQYPLSRPHKWFGAAASRARRLCLWVPCAGRA